MPHAEQDKSPTRFPRPPLVLVAEDDAEMRCLMVRALERDGYEVRGLGSGLLLFDELRRARARSLPEPALIVSDLRMPGLDGLSVLRQVRALGSRVPFILVTAFASEETLGLAEAAGATATFSKPFDTDDLRLAAMCFLGGKGPPTEEQGHPGGLD